MKRASRCSPMFIIAAVAIAVLTTTEAARAQGTMGTVPDPISARELEGYAERLRLSEQQYVAVASFHDEYREEFRVLREGEIEQFLNESRGLQGGGMGMIFDREADISKSLKALEAILGKIKGVDNRFFEQVETVLAEDQQPLMQGVRQARERARHRTGLSRMTSLMNPAAQADLSEMILDLTLSPDESQAVAALLPQYEASLTTMARKLHDGAVNMMQETLDKLAEQGLTPERMRDRERRGDFWQAARQIMTEVQLKLLAQAADISDLNRRTLRSLTASLSAENARSLRQQYHQRAYAEVNAGPGATARAFDLALKFDELTDEQRQAIAAMGADYNAASDRLIDQMLDMVDESRKTRTFFDFDAEKLRQYAQQLEELREKRAKLSASSRQTLEEALGPELAERLDRRVAEAGESEGSPTAHVTIGAMVGGGPGGMVAVRETAHIAIQGDADDDEPRPDPFLPGPITRRDVAAYAAMLKLSEESITILNSLHDDYLEKFELLKDGDIKTVREAERALWSMPPGGGQVNPPTPAAVENVYALRQRALAAIQALDSSFFEDVRSTLIDGEQSAAMERVTLARQRHVYNRGGDAGNMFMPGMRGREMRGRTERQAGGGPGRGGRAERGGAGARAFRMFANQSDEASVDLAALVDELKPEPADPAAFNAALLAYEQTVTAAFQKNYETGLRVQLARDRMMAEATSIEGGDRRVQITADVRNLMEGDGRAAREARQAIADLNKSSLATLSGMLPAGQAQSLRRAYNREAFPGVFRDPRSAEPHLAAALALGDLTEQQRSTIQEVAAEFHGAYDQMCERMLELEATAPDMGGPPQNRDWQAFQQRLRDREKLEFDRNELSDKALARLRAALTEPQIQQLGGLRTDEE